MGLCLLVLQVPERSVNINSAIFSSSFLLNSLSTMPDKRDNKQSVPVNGLYVFSFRVELKEQKNRKVAPCKWY